jgi:predicted peptidase
VNALLKCGARAAFLLISHFRSLSLFLAMTPRSLLPLFSLALAGLAFAQDPAPTQKAEHFEKQVSLTYRYDYLLYTPPGYGEDKAKKWPLIIFLHGSGEMGDDVQKVKKNGLPHELESKHDFPFLCISPQSHVRGWQVDALNALLDDALTRYQVDEDRVILTGLSMGGFGAWDWGGSNPERFAAVVPVCGAGSPIRARALKYVPVWAFHGENDPRVPLAWQESLVKILQETGGQVKWTVYPGVGHNSWEKAYADPELYTWMLAQKRKPVPPAPDRK